MSKNASLESVLLRGLASASPFAVTTFRNFGRRIRADNAQDAWVDALKEDPLLSLVPGVEAQFKSLYVESPRAAEVLLESL